jgi:hypothetical protein
MPTLLCRPPTSRERALQDPVRQIDPQWTRTGFPCSLWQDLPSPDALFGAALSLIELPPESRSARALCKVLLASPEFLSYLSNPANFNREQLTLICRVLMRLDPQLDARLAFALSSDCCETNAAAVLHVLAVLDDVSPGGRLAMALARLLRKAATSPIASKAALMFGRRVSNPLWVERQMASKDARTRANVIEALWGVNSVEARKSLRAALQDPNQRVLGNALVGLHLLGDTDVAASLRAMAAHPDPRFRSTAAWAMGRTGDRSHIGLLRAALDDSDGAVLASAARALAAFPAELFPATEAGMVAAEVGEAAEAPPPAVPEPEAGVLEPAKDEPADDEFAFRLDGSFMGKRF